VAPAGTPADVIATLNTALVKVLNDPDVVERIRALGAEPMPMTPVEYGAFIRTEIDKWTKVVGAGKPN
jgi:tripartite-type tricarboxylate transporter receptor subunit TctC